MIVKREFFRVKFLYKKTVGEGKAGSYRRKCHAYLLFGIVPLYISMGEWVRQ